jgi:hypothetical protein
MNLNGGPDSPGPAGSLVGTYMAVPFSATS